MGKQLCKLNCSCGTVSHALKAFKHFLKISLTKKVKYECSQPELNERTSACCDYGDFLNIVKIL